MEKSSKQHDGADVQQPEMGFVERYVSESFSLIEHPMAPGVLGAPMHTHTREDELSYIIHGTVIAQVGDRVITAGPRDVVWKPRGVPHAFWNPGPQPALVLELIVPGGFERYFRKLTAMARGSSGPPDRAAMATIQQEFGLEMDPASARMLIERYGLHAPRM